MEITFQFPENSVSKKEAFQAANGTSTMLKNVPEATVIEIEKFFTFMDEKDDGTSQEVVHIVSTSGERFSATSKPSIKMLVEYVHAVGDEIEIPIIVEVVRGKTKAGRDFQTLNIL